MLPQMWTPRGAATEEAAQTKSGGKVSVVESTRRKNPTMKKPSDDTCVDIRCVCHVSLISPRKMPKKKEAAPETTESAAPVGEYGILCELPFNELNLMRSPFVIKLGKNRIFAGMAPASELPQKEAKLSPVATPQGPKVGGSYHPKDWRHWPRLKGAWAGISR